MADTKITSLQPPQVGYPVVPATDVLPIVVIADPGMATSGSTRKITVNQLLGAGGTATLASATITGALGAAGLNVTGATIPANGVYLGSSNNLTFSFNSTLGMSLNSGGLLVNNTSGFNTVANIKLKVGGRFLSGISGVGAYSFGTADAGGFVINDAGDGSTESRLMTLNSTGLGIGTSPSTKLTVGAASPTLRLLDTNTAVNNGVYGTIDWLSSDSSMPGGLAAKIDVIDTATAGDRGAMRFFTNDGSSLAERLRIDAAGNVGIGVTPSAWGGGRKAIQIASPANIVSANLTFEVGSNWWNDGTNYKYTATNPASLYSASNGLHAWYISTNTPSAGGTITFTQAMTLAANGQLLLGTSSTNGAVDIGMVMNKPSATGFVGNVYQLNSVDKAFTYIASATNAYRVDTVAGYTINMVSSTNGVYLANGGTSWLALSDERFKDIIEPISNAVAKVGSLRSVIGKFKSEAEGTRRSFLIAQDVQAVLPEAVDATKPEQLGVSYSDVIPLLVAAIKELTARVQTLEAK